MKIALLLLCCFGFLQTSAFAGIETDIPPTNRVVLKSGEWQPSDAETVKALGAVGAFLENSKHDKGEIAKIKANLAKYRVQFIGANRGGKKIILCNFFPAPPVDGVDYFTYWRGQRVQVADGGFWFWRIEYEPATGECMNFAANGVA